MLLTGLNNEVWPSAHQPGSLDLWPSLLLRLCGNRGRRGTEGSNHQGPGPQKQDPVSAQPWHRLLRGIHRGVLLPSSQLYISM